jgi:hypothetical protein
MAFFSCQLEAEQSGLFSVDELMTNPSAYLLWSSLS